MGACMSAEVVSFKDKGLFVEEIPPARWPELFGAHEPFKSCGFPDPNNTRAIAVLDREGRLRAYWWLVTAVHLEPLWIAPEDRRNPGLIRTLWNKVKEVARANGVASGF